MRLERCNFCSSTVYPGHGSTYVRNDCKVIRFCRSKCKKNFDMKRNPRKVAWTKAFRHARGKDMVLDSTFDFEAKRNRPVKYNRDLMAQTIYAMRKVSEIRSKRERRFWERRQRAAQPKRKEEAVKTIEKSAHLAKKRVTQVNRPGKVKVDAERKANKMVE